MLDTSCHGSIVAHRGGTIDFETRYCTHREVIATIIGFYSQLQQILCVVIEGIAFGEVA